jgi:hypothetical protein
MSYTKVACTEALGLKTILLYRPLSFFFFCFGSFLGFLNKKGGKSYIGQTHTDTHGKLFIDFVICVSTLLETEKKQPTIHSGEEKNFCESVGVDRLQEKETSYTQLFNFLYPFFSFWHVKLMKAYSVITKQTCVESTKVL